MQAGECPASPLSLFGSSTNKWLEVRLISSLRLVQTANPDAVLPERGGWQMDLLPGSAH